MSATHQALVSRAHREHGGPVYKGCQAQLGVPAVGI